MTHQLRIQPNTNNEIILDSSDIVSLDHSRTHTGIGDFQATVGFDLSLEDETLSEILLEDGSTLLFRGYILGVSSDNQAATTTLKGTGIAEDLTDGKTTRTFSNVFAHNAIDTYWTDETSFSATVTEPSADTTVTNQSEQEANVNSEFTNISTIGDTEPFVIQNDRFELAQSLYLAEGENPDSGSGTTVSESEYSSGSAEELDDTSDDVSYTFTTEYKIPSGNVAVGYRLDAEGGTNPPYDIEIDNTDVETVTADALTDGVTWRNVEGITAVGDLAAGSHDVDFELSGTGGGGMDLDVVCLYDDRFSYNFDNTTDANGFLSGPELYPDARSESVFAFDTGNTPWRITDGQVDYDFQNGNGNAEAADKVGQQLTNEGTWHDDNSPGSSGSFTYDYDANNELGTDIKARVGLKRSTETRTTATPTTGFVGVHLNDYELFYDGDDIAVIDSLTVEGNHLTNLQRLHNYAEMRFVVEHKENSKTVESFRSGDVTKSQPDWDIINRTRSKDLTNYANEVTFRGAKSGGSRLTQTLQDDSEVSAEGTKHAEGRDKTLDTQDEVDSAARKLLGQKVSEKDKTGELTIAPLGLAPGFSYPVDWSDGTQNDLPLEEVSYRVRNGEIQGNLTFDFTIGIAESIAGLRNETSSLFQA